MKLRTRGPPRSVNGFADEDMGVVETPSSRRRPPRKSVAPRAAPEPPEPTPARSRARTAPKAPKGGVQKRKSVRPTARPRTAAPTPSRSSRRTIRPPESLPPLADDDHHEDAADGAAKEADVKVEDVNQEKRVVKATVKTTIDDLPEEVMLGIFSYFRPPQLCWKIGRVCRRWASWSVAPFLWRGKEYTLSPDPNLSSRRKGNAQPQPGKA